MQKRNRKDLEEERQRVAMEIAAEEGYSPELITPDEITPSVQRYLDAWHEVRGENTEK